MRRLLPCLVALGLLACDDHDHDHDHGHHDVGVSMSDVAIGCQHFEFGPEVALSATAANDADTPGFAEAHHRYDIALSGGAGFVTYTPQAAGVHLLMVGDATPLTVLDPEGAVVAPKRVERPVADCAAAGAVYHLQVEAQRYTLAFGPGGAEMVSLVVHVPVGHAHDAGHGHDADGGHHVVGDAGADDPEASAYCECMLFNCHDPFHARWGVDDGEAIAACLAAMADVPRAGAPASEGDSLECRAHFCTAAADGDPEANCTNALGDAVCE